jgi:phenylacetate-coenzyme A ligase PaaK-like adenylate-forming protein
MDLSRLKERMIVKNYKDMCKLLGEEIKTGKSKQYQLKEWKRYFDYDKDKQNFIINIIYDEPLEHNGKNIYIQHIEYLLLNYISQQKGYKIQLTFRQLLKH